MRLARFVRRATETATKARQNMLRIEPEESLLVRTRRVKDQMIEAEIDVVADPLDMLVRIGRDDPAARGALGRQPVGEALHLSGSWTDIFSSGVSARTAQWRVSSIARFMSVSNETLTSIMR